ncbi:isatin hydrolase-like [Amblyomma americanum]
MRLHMRTWLLYTFWALFGERYGPCHGGVAVPAALCQRYEIVDLSYSFNNRTVYWNDGESYKLDVTIHNATRAGWFQVDTMSEPIHGGTHLDSPVHFYQDGWDATQIPLERLLFLPVACVDVRTQVSMNSEYLLSVDDIQNWERQHGRLPDGCLFVAHTGHSKHWPNRTAYMGIDANGDKHFPALDPEAAEFLATQRSVFGVGLDTPSADAGSGSAAHRALMRINIFVLENLVGLEQIPARGAYALVLPLKLDGASGSPVRVVALVP